MNLCIQDDACFVHCPEQASALQVSLVPVIHGHVAAKRLLSSPAHGSLGLLVLTGKADAVLTDRDRAV